MSGLDIQCPRCQSHAVFQYVQTCRIAKKVDLPFFESSTSFRIEWRQNGGNRYRVAAHYRGLDNAIENAGELPEGYTTGMWSRVSIPYASDALSGVAFCANCQRHSRHTLEWPTDAWFQLDYRGQTLWAYDRASALKLLRYIESDSRTKGLDYTCGGHAVFRTVDRFLYRVPTHFQTAKARPYVLRALKRKLGLSL